MIGNLQAVARDVPVLARRNAGCENRNFAVVRIEPDQRLAKQRVEGDDVLVAGDERNEGTRIRRVCDAQHVGGTERAPLARATAERQQTQAQRQQGAAL